MVKVTMAQPCDDQFSCRALRGWSCLFLMKFLVAGETIWPYLQVILRIIPNREFHMWLKPLWNHGFNMFQPLSRCSFPILLKSPWPRPPAQPPSQEPDKKEATWTDPMETEVPWNSLHFGYEITTFHHVLLITMLLYHVEINNWNSETLHVWWLILCFSLFSRYSLASSSRIPQGFHIEPFPFPASTDQSKSGFASTNTLECLATLKPHLSWWHRDTYIYILIHPVDDLVSASRDFGWNPTSVGPKHLRRPKTLSHAPDRCAHSNVDLIITAIAAAVAVTATATAAFLRLCQGSSSSTCANIGRNWLLVSPRKVLVTWDHPK